MPIFVIRFENNIVYKSPLLKHQPFGHAAFGIPIAANRLVTSPILFRPVTMAAVGSPGGCYLYKLSCSHEL